MPREQLKAPSPVEFVGPVDHFLVFGAGASFGARDNPRPPLGVELARYVLHWLEANDPRWLDFERHCDMDNPLDGDSPPRDLWNEGNDWYDAKISDLRQFLFRVAMNRRGIEAEAGKLWKQGDKDALIRLLNQTISYSMMCGHGCAFSPGFDVYDHLFAKLRGQRLCVVTVNYDMLAEEAIERVNGPGSAPAYYYPGMRDFNQQTVGVPVLKLNGSVNWLHHFSIVTTSGDPDNAPMAVPLGLGGPHNKPDTQIEVAPTGHKNIVMTMKGSIRSRTPLLALYCDGKPAPFNAPALEHVRNKTMQAIRDNPSAAVTIAGIRWPKKNADPGLLEVLSSLAGVRGQRTFVDPDQKNCARAKRDGFQCVQTGFREYVDSIAAS